MNQHDKPTTHDDLAPLDDFERQWTGLLAEHEPDLSRSEDAFVNSVIDRHTAASAGPAVIGRIGFAPLPFAAAAALLIAALVGWYLITGPGSTPGADEFATPPIPEPQPEQPKQVDKVDPAKIPLGRMISQTQTAMTQPASNLTQTVRDTPQALRMERLLDLIETPIPDLKRMLEPLKQNDQQSRA